MPRVPSAVLEQIRAANDIVEIIGGAVALKRAGANFRGLCPFHKEKTPSFNVHPGKQIFHCFGCHKGGDVFVWMQEFENLSFFEAVKRLAERAGIPLQLEESAAADAGRAHRELLYQIHESIAARWHEQLLKNPSAGIARDYLARRGVSQESIELFRLGYAPDAWDDTVRWAQQKKYAVAEMEQSGLIIPRDGGGHYDRFRGRLMFPICDEQGRVVAFSGRVLKGDEKTAKYVNSPETPIFTKSKVFFGLDKAKRAMLEAKFAVVCEGQLDLIAAHTAGVRNIVAPQGTAFTADHARILKRFVEEVVLCFDSDSAGQTAAVRVFDSLLASDLAIRVAVLPAPHDPDSFIREFGAEAFIQLIKESPGFFDFYLDRLCRTNDLQSDRGRIAVAREMAETVSKTGNSILIDSYAQKTAMRLGVTPQAMRSEFERTERRAARSDREQEEETAPARPPTPTTEVWLLRFLFQADDQADWLAAHLNLDWIRAPSVRRILEARFALPRTSGSDGVPARLLDEIDDPEARRLITEATAQDRPLPNAPQQIKDLVTRLRNEAIDVELSAMLRRLADPALSEAQRNDLLRQTTTFRQFKRSPLQPLGEA